MLNTTNPNGSSADEISSLSVNGANSFNPSQSGALDVIGRQASASGGFSAYGSGLDSSQVTFIDTNIDEYQRIADSVIAGDVFLLDTVQDGVSQITKILSQYDNLTGLHIVSHGRAGELQLGSTTLDAQSLDSYQDELLVWSDALTEGADVLLYGCDVAAGAHGSDFVQDLSAALDADVAASDDLTGSEALMGDWDLEFRTGAIEADATLSQNISAAFEGVLASFSDLSEVRIMPLGDSITQGNAEYNSYRRPLWQRLNARGYGKVDFVGTQTKNGEFDVPNPDFDLNHEGYGGRRADQIADNIRGWATTANPDVVLLHLGTNDIIQGESVSSTISDIGNIIDTLRETNPNIAILLAQVTPSIERRSGRGISALNDQIPGLVNSKNRAGSPVILVDQESGFSPTEDTYDGLHADVGGEIKMAERWFSALDSLFKSGHQYRRSNGGGQGPTAAGNGTGLKAEYFNNMNFSQLVSTRNDSTINFDWGGGAPISGMGNDTFSVRWSGQIEPRYNETYTFYTTTDDGVRLWVDGQLVVDQFVDQAPSTFSGSITLNAGQKYDIRMEYFENGGGATASLAWSSASQAFQIVPQSQLYNVDSGNTGGGNTGGAGSGQPPTPAGSGDGLSVVYYDNIDFSGAQVAGVSSTVNYDWGAGSPNRNIGVDTFSARWTGQVEARYDETYRFYTTSDDGIRLWVNGQLIIDGFRDQPATEYSGAIALQAGQKYDIRLDYYENGRDAVAALSWSSASQAKEIIPQSQLYSGGNGGNTGGGNGGSTGGGGNTGGTGGGQPPTPAGSGDGLSVVYYDNIDFSGAQVAGVSSTVNYDWGAGSPNRNIGVDTFSARWTGQVEARYDETYRFYTTSDDGIRLWVNGQLIIDGFRDQPATEYSGAIALQAGQKYDIRLDYYENGRDAVAALSWSSASQAKEIIPQSQLYSGGNGSNTGGGNTGGSQPPSPAGSGDGLSVVYYDNINFSGAQVAGISSTVNYNWGAGSPNGAIGVDTFSARWTGKVEARYNETYRFYTTTDDGIRLWVNGQLVIDGFRDQPSTEYSGAIALQAGQKYDIRLDYYENGGDAVAALAWSSASQAKEIIPQSQLYSA